jgi:hypothetical protein
MSEIDHQLTLNTLDKSSFGAIMYLALSRLSRPTVGLIRTRTTPIMSLSNTQSFTSSSQNRTAGPIEQSIRAKVANPGAIPHA